MAWVGVEAARGARRAGRCPLGMRTGPTGRWSRRSGLASASRQSEASEEPVIGL